MLSWAVLACVGSSLSTFYCRFSAAAIKSLGELCEPMVSSLHGGHGTICGVSGSHVSLAS